MSKEKVPNIFSVNRKTKLINVGRFVDQKDQITILKSIKYIKDKFKIDSFEVVIIGRGCLKNKLRSFIDKNDLQNEITLLDYKKNPYPYIKQADIFLLSSKSSILSFVSFSEYISILFIPHIFFFGNLLMLFSKNSKLFFDTPIVLLDEKFLAVFL